MRLLVDTHVLVWAAMEPERLAVRASALLADRSNDILVIAASAYEIEYKRARDSGLNALPLDLREVVAGLDFTWLDVTPRHAIEAGRLPRLHGDPFDRLLAAQAIGESAALVTRDRRIAGYGGSIIPA